jgi:hypothetical protein
MFTVNFVNFPVSRNFKTLENAKNYCVSSTYEAVIYENGVRIGSYSYFGGFRFDNLAGK